MPGGKLFRRDGQALIGEEPHVHGNGDFLLFDNFPLGHEVSFIFGNPPLDGVVLLRQILPDFPLVEPFILNPSTARILLRIFSFKIPVRCLEARLITASI